MASLTADHLLDADAGPLATALRDGTSTVTDHTRAVLRRIGERDTTLHAVSQLVPDALEEAARLDALRTADVGAARALPLFGVPVVVKEEIPVRGVVTTFGGSGNLSPAAEDAEVVRRLRDAGAVVVATTRMPEAGQVPFTEGAWGSTRNPWAGSRTPGGSSGGSAVAVSARYVPLALGGDGGGSVRIPAAWCGIAGLKPTRTRLSTEPFDGVWEDLGTFGPMARTAADLTLAWEVLRDDGPTEDHAAGTGDRNGGALRVGWTTSCPEPFVRLDAEVARGLEAAALALRDRGHDVRRGSVRFPATLPAFLPQATRAVRATVHGLDQPERAERRTRQFGGIGGFFPDSVLAWAWGRGAQIGRDLERIFEHVDVLLMPVEPTPAPPARRLAHRGTLANQLASRTAIAYTAVWNVSGHPTASVPVGLSAQGLPLAVQVVGALGADETVVRVVAEIEAALGVLPAPPLGGA